MSLFKIFKKQDIKSNNIKPKQFIENSLIYKKVEIIDKNLIKIVYTYEGGIWKKYYGEEVAITGNNYTYEDFLRMICSNNDILLAHSITINDIVY